MLWIDFDKWKKCTVKKYTFGLNVTNDVLTFYLLFKNTLLCIHEKKIQVLQWIQCVYTLHEILDNVFAPKNWHVYILLEQYFNKIYVYWWAEVQQVIFLCHYMIPPKKPKIFTRYTTSNLSRVRLFVFFFKKCLNLSA